MVDRVDERPCSSDGGTERQCGRNDEGREVDAGAARYPNALVTGEPLVGFLSSLDMKAAPAARVIGIPDTCLGGAHAQVVQQCACAQEERG